MESGEYKKLGEYYKLIADQIVIEKYSLKRLDERFGECSAGFIPAGDRNEDGLQFLSVLNRPHLERLSEERLLEFRNMAARENMEDELVSFVEASFRDILEGDPRPNVQYEYFRDIHGRGIFPGNSLVLLFRDKVQYDPAGKVDWNGEARKEEVFAQVKEQFEELVNQKGDCPVFLVRRQVN